MIAFDSNLLIYFLSNHPEFGKKSEEIFRQIDNEGGVCSSIIITETMYGTIDSIEKITPLKSQKISVMPVSLSVAQSAGNLKIAYGLKNIDAIHLATAVTSGADRFVTNDQALLKKIIPGITICGL